MSFLRSGSYAYSGGALNYRGTAGRYWSLRNLSDVSAYGLSFDSVNVNPLTVFYHGTGLSLRCLAR